MDDPMTRSRLDRVNGTRPLGEPDPKRAPHFSFAHNMAFLRLYTYLIPPICHDSARPVFHRVEHCPRLSLLDLTAPAAGRS